MAARKIRVTLKKRGSKERHRITLLGIGLRKIDDTKVLNDTLAIRGMIGKVQHLITVEEAR